ncbi:hypothetical protein GW17_00031903 [Ensete ventricosum]|nr:hypothetical protein GW17_00031903 [Ensete ventricosum]
MFLHHQSLGGDVLVGPLQHLWYSYGGLLHKRPKKVGKPDLDHKSLDDQRWMRIENGPDIVYEASEVLSKVFLLLLSHPEEGCDNWLPSGAREEIALELPCEEPVESEDSVSGYGKLRVDALGAGSSCLVASPTGSWLDFEEKWGRLSAERVVSGGDVVLV